MEPQHGIPAPRAPTPPNGGLVVIGLGIAELVREDTWRVDVRDKLTGHLVRSCKPLGRLPLKHDPDGDGGASFVVYGYFYGNADDRWCACVDALSAPQSVLQNLEVRVPLRAGVLEVAQAGDVTFTHTSGAVVQITAEGAVSVTAAGAVAVSAPSGSGITLEEAGTKLLEVKSGVVSLGADAAGALFALLTQQFYVQYLLHTHTHPLGPTGVPVHVAHPSEVTGNTKAKAP